MPCSGHDFEVLGKELGERAGQPLGRIADPEPLTHTLARAGNDRLNDVCKPGRQSADIRR